MSSIKPLVKNYVMIEQTTQDVDLNYPRTPSFVLAIIQLICGLFSIALGIGAICTQSSGYFIGYGIWCGFLFLLAGIFVVITCYCTHTCMIMTSMVFAIMAACAGVIQFSLGIVAAANDNGNLENGRLAWFDSNIPRYDIYYIRQYRDNLCAGSSFGWTSSWGPVDILLILVAFIEIVAAVTSAAFGCASMCCGHINFVRTNSNQDSIQRLAVASSNQEPGFINQGYEPQTYILR